MRFKLYMDMAIALKSITENIIMWLSLLVSHPKVLKMGQHIVQNKGMTPKREKMRHVKETEDAPE